MSVDLIDDSKKITIWDMIVVVVYFVTILGASVYVSSGEKNLSMHLGKSQMV